MFALDIGCGENSKPALKLVKEGYIVIALENNPYVVNEYRSRLNDHKGGGISSVIPIIADAKFLPFKEESFDLIIAYYAFDWISILGEPEDIERASREVKKSLKRGCKLIVHEYWKQGKASRKEVLKSVGFTIEVKPGDEIVLTAVKQGE